MAVFRPKVVAILLLILLGASAVKTGGDKWSTPVWKKGYSGGGGSWEGWRESGSGDWYTDPASSSTWGSDTADTRQWEDHNKKPRNRSKDRKPRSSSRASAPRDDLEGDADNPSTSSRASAPRGVLEVTAEWGAMAHETATGLGAVFSNEGKDGKYTCYECSKETLRQEVLIEASRPEADWQGGLFGRCYECCRGRGPATSTDMFEGNPKIGEERRIRYEFTKMARKMHAQRSDVKKRQLRRLRTATFEELLMEQRIASGKPIKECRKFILQFLTKAVRAVIGSVTAGSPKLLQSVRDVMRRYEAVKVVEAAGDNLGIITPGGEVIKENYQWLHRISNNTSRHFLCRNKYCRQNKVTKKWGSYFGLNTSWISTVAAGGWHFACPCCMSPFKFGAKSSFYIPAHFVMVLEETGQALLSAWPDGAEEDAIANLMEKFAEEELGDFRAMDTTVLQTTIMDFIRSSATPLQWEDIPLTDEVKSMVAEENAKRTKQKPWGYEGLEGGFRGAFFEWEEGSPIMSEEDTRTFLAAVKVQMDRVFASKM